MSSDSDYFKGYDDAFRGRPNLRLSILYDIGFADGLNILYTFNKEEEHVPEIQHR